MYSYTHGGDIYSLQNRQLLDFSANINPFGLPEGVKKAIRQAAEGCDIYPDPLCRKLRQAIAGLEDIPAESIFCSNGAADIIFRIAAGLKPRRALLPVPSFTEYEEALKAAGCDIEYFYMTEEQGFLLNEEILQRLTGEIDILFLCSPNNPTGLLIESGLLERIVSACQRNRTIVVLDECFIDFLENGAELSAKKLMGRYGNLVIIKAFTKLYAMAGVRLGYCFTANEGIIEKLYSCGAPWSVSYIAQQAGIAAVNEKDYVNRSLAAIEKERDRLSDALGRLGFTVYPSKANFIFFRINRSADLKGLLLKKNILIRSCENYKGLTKEFYRIAVKTPKENDILIQAVTSVAAEEFKNG